MILCLPRSTLFPYTTLFRSDVEGRKLSLSHKQTTENPWDAHEKTYGIGTIHNGSIAELNDKGATINFEEDVVAFIPTRHLDKEDGKKLKRSEEHTSELQSRPQIVCRLPPEK